MGYQQISDYLKIPLTTVKDTISKKDLEGKERRSRRRNPKTSIVASSNSLPPQIQFLS